MKTCRTVLFPLLLASLSGGPVQAMSIAGEPTVTSAVVNPATPEPPPATVTTVAEVTAVSEAKQTVSLNGIVLPLASDAVITPAYGSGKLSLGDLRSGMRVRAQVSADQNNRKILTLWIMQ